MDAQKESIPTMKINYDPKSDIFYCSFGDPRVAVSVETREEGIILRLDPDTDEIIGFTVIDFSKRFQDHPTNFLTLSPSKEMAALLNSHPE